VIDWLTGKFVLEVREDARGDKYLSVTAELRPGIEANDGMANALADSIRTQLLRLNSEFSHYVPPERQTPAVMLLGFGDAEYFPVGVKHRYTRRSNPT
jgi:phenylacetate-CoA ligase